MKPPKPAIQPQNILKTILSKSPLKFKDCFTNKKTLSIQNLNKKVPKSRPVSTTSNKSPLTKSYQSKSPQKFTIQSRQIIKGLNSPLKNQQKNSPSKSPLKKRQKIQVTLNFDMSQIILMD